MSKFSNRSSDTLKSSQKEKNNSVFQKVNQKGPKHSTPMGENIDTLQSAGNQEVQRLMKSGKIQAKLKISDPNDEYEKEADRVAEQVVNMPDPGISRQTVEEEDDLIQTKPIAETITPLVQRQADSDEDEEMVQPKLSDSVQRQTEEDEELIQPKLKEKIQRQSEDDDEELLQGKLNSSEGTREVSPGIEAQINSLKGGGQPLPKEARDYFEPRFGVDLGDVMLHEDNESNNIAQSLNAKAVTIDNNIIFNKNQNIEKGNIGSKLMAHELSHFLQQKGNIELLQKQSGDEEVFRQKIQNKCKIEILKELYEKIHKKRMKIKNKIMKTHSNLLKAQKSFEAFNTRSDMVYEKVGWIIKAAGEKEATYDNWKDFVIGIVCSIGVGYLFPFVAKIKKLSDNVKKFINSKHAMIGSIGSALMAKAIISEIDKKDFTITKTKTEEYKKLLKVSSEFIKFIDLDTVIDNTHHEIGKKISKLYENSDDIDIMETYIKVENSISTITDQSEDIAKDINNISNEMIKLDNFTFDRIEKMVWINWISNLKSWYAKELDNPIIQEYLLDEGGLFHELLGDDIGSYFFFWEQDDIRKRARILRSIFRLNDIFIIIKKRNQWYIRIDFFPINIPVEIPYGYIPKEGEEVQIKRFTSGGIIHVEPL